jgi:hypothetical protein
MPKDTSKIYRLDEAFVTDPFAEIINPKRKENVSDHAIYNDYEQSPDYLRAIWKRLQKEYWDMYLARSKLTHEKEFDPENEYLKEEIMNAQLILLDSESFIIFANRFMDRVGKSIERMIKRDDGNRVKAGFEENIAFFTKGFLMQLE